MANPIGPLRQVLEDTMAEDGLKMQDLTVLAVQNDPYRIDTPAGHRDGQWLAEIIADPRLGLAGRTIHLRGLHYAILSLEARKPNGFAYRNTTEDWKWLQEKAADAARWLQYVPFEAIVDHRNAPPVVRRFKKPEPDAYISVGLDIEVPLVEDIVPAIRVEGISGFQPYKLVFFGEKSSLEPVLGPIAEQRKADLYLPTGEISDTMLHQMASIGAADGRPMVVFCFSD